jgi:hypothetical protein
MNSERKNPERMEPTLRHEFVGMMFALTIGEVGLQAAALVKTGHFVHYLPAYSHLLVATVMIATSWVGWSLSRAPGARLDVTGIFQWEFVILLLDVSMVITYFILVRAFEFEKTNDVPRIDPPSSMAFWIAVIFGLYIVWDFVTKVFIRPKKTDATWFEQYGRMLPTVGCLIFAVGSRYLLRSADMPHYLTADLALLSLVLLFRALKDLVSAVTKKPRDQVVVSKIRWSSFWTILCIAGLAFGILATWHSWDWVIPDRIAQEIRSVPPSSGDIP